MSFVDAAFPLFVLVALFVDRLVPGAHRQVRLAASVVFYAWGGVTALGVLLVSALLNWVVLGRVAAGGSLRRWWVGWAIVLNLLPLAVLKYGDFAVAELGRAGGPVWAPPDWALPLGISFWSFQALGLTLDVARGDAARPRDLVDHLLFLLWFPQLVAGPIERVARLLPQLQVRVPVGAAASTAALGLVLRGAVKKVVVAEGLAPYVDKVFARQEPGASLLAVAGLAFMVQVYADFSGYTDIARGVSALFGVRLSENFRQPWRAASPPEFWSRWHVTMTTWVRDYALGPLLGSGTPSPLRQAVVVSFVLVAMGAWHGAGWNYLAFGLWHAGWMLLWGWSGLRTPRGGLERRLWGLGFHVVILWLGALIFREPDPLRLVATLTSSWSVRPADAVALATLLALTAAGGALVRAAESAEAWVEGVADGGARRPLRATSWAVGIALVAVFSADMASDFLYFRF